MSFCCYCKRILNSRRQMKRGDRNTGLDFTVDHKIPLCRGGPDSPPNKVPCCHRCNNLKADMTDAEFFKYIGLYGFENQPHHTKEAMKYETEYRRIR